MHENALPPSVCRISAGEHASEYLPSPRLTRVDIRPDHSYPELGIRSFGKGTFHKPPLTGADASGTSENGMTFQQFDGGVISSKGDTAYITWGKIRDAWNVKRDDTGAPSESGKGGSSGPLGAPTSDETDEGGLKQSTFENGKITWDPKTDTTEVTVKDKVVPAK